VALLVVEVGGDVVGLVDGIDVGEMVGDTVMLGVSVVDVGTSVDVVSSPSMGNPA